ncbi:PAS domain-containing protein [Chondromyces apiculatus]|uniref:RsbR, positive regulator of sigma-B n=1 Tax=Chondromyces apiculatus DSM 436 TaxID=1192034 RepID=A0A017TER1_9BACT|nr:PAS domain-containing protein [Chondromyces apiculatus]EYF07788.1 RsbR, positive regulator of sigma-B [Chondromyces apiculatus DSM 436]
MEAELQTLRDENQRLHEQVAKLEREAALYREVFEGLPVPVTLTRGDGVLVDINRRNRELLGVPSREAVVGHYNSYEDPAAVSQGYAAGNRAAVEARFGELVVMEPSFYATGEASFEGQDDRTVWTQTMIQGVEASGVRYAVGVNLDITARVRAERATEESRAFLGGIIDNAPVLIYAKDLEGRYLLMNRECERTLGLPQGAMLGKTDRDFYPDQADFYAARDREALFAPAPLVNEDLVPVGGQIRHFVTTKFPLHDEAGKPYALCSISLDITGRREAEAETKRLQEEMFRVQEATLRALSTPLLPIAEGVVVMPLIGMLDEKRVQQAMDVLLSGIAAHHASQVILDVTGVPQVNAQVANALVQAAQAVRLLGAQVAVTGIQPAIARILIELGVDLGALQTRGTLQSGIAHALAARAKKSRS